jgi:hypothetical protein
MGKAHGWGLFLKHKGNLNYHGIILGCPYFENDHTL